MLHELSRSIAVVALAMVLTSAHATAQGLAPAEPKFDVVVVNGDSTIKAAPDRAWVTISVENRAKVPRDAQRQNGETMTAVQGRLRAAGLPADAVRTVSIELTPEFDYANGRQQLRGYVARNSIELRVDDLDRLGEFIDAAVGTGATNVTGVRFDVKRREELEREALRQAVTQARAKAEAMAAGAGRVIDRIVRIEDAESPPPMPRPMAMVARSEMAVEAFTPVAPGEVEIRARVTITAALK